MAPTPKRPTPAASAPKMKLPSDLAVYLVDGVANLVANLGSAAQPVYIHFGNVDTKKYDLTGHATYRISNQQFADMDSLGAGDASELEPLAGGSFNAWWKQLADNLLPATSGARTDQGVLRVLREVAADPTLKDAPTYITNRLKETDWYQGRSDAALAWDQASKGQRTMLQGEEANKLAALWQTNVGTPISSSDSRIMQWAEQVASGQRGEGAVLSEDIVPTARLNDESPRSRTERDATEAGRARPIDIENKAADVAALYKQWGIAGQQSTFDRWANDIVGKTKSDADLLAELKGQAQTLYPWKNPETETVTAAQPWVDTYSRVMEKPNVGLTDPDIQKALTAGTPLWQFEKDLKAKPEWMQTKNARDDMTAGFAQVGKLMGFG